MTNKSAKDNASRDKWRHYNVFISSTFKDMDYERDLIKRSIIPALNSHYNNLHISLQVIDLRMGINTDKMSEEEAASKVLDICAGNIDRARPFFIGLIGQRYGWVPPLPQWQKFINSLPSENQKEMRDTLGASVTELEMVYGALTPYSLNNSHAIFFIRDEASYNGMDKETRSRYTDTSENAQHKLSLLKQRVTKAIGSLGGNDDSVSTYHLAWDNDNKCFCDADKSFTFLMCTKIKALIDAELDADERKLSVFDFIGNMGTGCNPADAIDNWLKRETAQETAKLQRWEWEERETLIHFKRLAASACTDLHFYHANFDHSFMIGEMRDNGSSTLLAYLWQRRRNETDDVCLAAAIGHSRYSWTMRDVMMCWCLQLAKAAGIEPWWMRNIGEYTSEEKPMADVYDLFNKLVDLLEDKGRRVSVFIDDLDLLRIYAPSDMYLPWARKSLYIAIVCNGCCDYPQLNNIEFIDWRKDIEWQLNEDDIAALTSHFAKQYFIEMPQEVVDMMKEDRPTIGAIRMFYEMIANDMYSNSFKAIREEGGNQANALNKFITEVYRNVFAASRDGRHKSYGYRALSFSLYARYTGLELSQNGIDEDTWSKRLAMLSVCPIGMTEKQITAYKEPYILNKDGKIVNDKQYFTNRPSGSADWATLSSHMHFLLACDADSKRMRTDLPSVPLQFEEADVFNPYEQLAAHICNLYEFDRLIELMPYFVIKSKHSSQGLDALWSDEYSCHVGAVSANMLVTEQWFENGECEAYLNGMKPAQRNKLLHALKEDLEPNGDKVPIISHTLLDRVKANIAFAIDSYFQIQTEIDESLHDPLRFALDKINTMLGEKPNKDKGSKRMFMTYTHSLEKLLHNEDKHAELLLLLEAIAAVDTSLYHDTDENGMETHPLNDEWLLEDIVLWTAELAATAFSMYATCKEKPEEDKAYKIGEAAMFTLYIAYNRLCLVNPANRLSHVIANYAALLGMQLPRVAGTSALVRAIDMLQDAARL